MPEGRVRGFLIEPGGRYEDEYGQERFAEETRHRVSAMFYEAEGTENIGGFGVNAPLPVRIFVRVSKPILGCNPDWKFEDQDGRVFGIIGVRRTGRRKRQLSIQAVGEQ